MFEKQLCFVSLVALSNRNHKVWKGKRNKKACSTPLTFSISNLELEQIAGEKRNENTLMEWKKVLCSHCERDEIRP